MRGMNEAELKLSNSDVVSSMFSFWERGGVGWGGVGGGAMGSE